MKATRAKFARRKAFQRRVTAGSALIVVDVVYGLVKIVSTHRVEGNRIIFGGYSIEYDQNGREVRRTKDEPISEMYVN